MYCCTDNIVSQIFSYKEDKIIFYNNTLYLYFDNYWHEDIDDHIACKWLNQKITTILLSLQKRLIDDLNSIDGKIDISKESNRIEKIIVGIIKSIGNRLFCRNAVKDSYVDFTSYKTELFNSNYSLIPFVNGAYDLYKGEFRSNKKEDYVTSLIQYSYNSEVNNENVMKFLQTILPNQNVLDYVLKQCANALDGNIPNNIFLMLTGTGGNGKTLFLTLLEKTFDVYGTSLNSTTLTRKEADSNSASPGLVKLRYKKFASISESEKKGEINTALLKRLTGNDTIVARELYKREQEYTIRTKFFLACNSKPAIDAADEAIWRRVKVVEFTQKFVSNPDVTIFNQHKIDTTLMNTINNDITWRQTMMNILLSYYNKEVDTPKEVESYTNSYKNDNNDFENWLDDNLIEDKEGYIELKHIISNYTESDKIHSKISSLYKKLVINYIRKKYPKSNYEYKKRRINNNNINCWIGFKINKEIKKFSKLDEQK